MVLGFWLWAFLIESVDILDLYFLSLFAAGGIWFKPSRVERLVEQMLIERSLDVTSLGPQPEHYGSCKESEAGDPSPLFIG